MAWTAVATMDLSRADRSLLVVMSRVLGSPSPDPGERPDRVADA
jgi:hypothetical protein